MSQNNNQNKELNQANQEKNKNLEISFELKEYLKSIKVIKGKYKVIDEHTFLEMMFLLTPKQLKILNSYLYLASKHSTCYVSIPKIAENSGVCKKTVQRFLQQFKNVFWIQEERQSQTHLIYVEEWLKESYRDLIKVIKHLNNLQDRKKYLINQCYNKGLTFKDLRVLYEQSVNKKRSQMSPPNRQNVTQYSSLYSSHEKIKPLHNSESNFNEVQIKINWEKYNLNQQQMRYLSTNFSYNSIIFAQNELNRQKRMEKPIKSEFAYLYSLAKENVKERRKYG